MPVASELEGGVLLALARGLAVLAMLALFGTLAFRLVVLPRACRGAAPEVATGMDRRLQRLTGATLGVAVPAMLLWSWLEAGTIAGAPNLAGTAGALPVVLWATAFGHIATAQLLLLLLCWRLHARPYAAMAAAATVLALQAGHSHTASMDEGPGLLLAASVLHLLAAGAWLGGLMPLLLFVRHAPPRDAARAARWFSPLGKLCVVALAATALWQGWALIGSVPGLVGTAYGQTALVKLVLFGVLFLLAVLNRYRLAPALLRTDPARARRALLRSLAVQTAAGLGAVAAAAVLSSLPPAMHVQPLWPFPDLFTLETVQEDPDFLREVVGALVALVGAAILLGLGIAARRRVAGWVAGALGVAVAASAVPHLDLLFVPAYPTSYYHSPTGFAAGSIAVGAALFPSQCAVCHGSAGRGDGPAAKALPVPPADLTAEHLWMHSDGELFWWLAHGIPAPDGRPAMPGFAGVLSEEQRWALIDYVRAHNAGLVFTATGGWTPPVQAPEVQATCAGDREVQLADLRGGFVRLVLGPAGAVPGVTTILATSDPAAQPGPGLCVAADRQIATAYAIVTGRDPAAMAGTEFLIDPAGWLRAVHPPGAAPGWAGKGLEAELAQLRARPIEAPSSTMQMPM